MTDIQRKIMAIGLSKDDIVIEPHQVYEYAFKLMKPEDIDHHGNGKGFDDLYLRKNPQSYWIAKHMKNTSLLSSFKSSVDGSMWYEFPFCYPVIDDRRY